MTALKKTAKYLPFVAILILSLLPVYYTWGRLPIWGDTIIPFNSKGLEKYLYQWISLQNGQYFSVNYLPYFLFFKFIEFFTHNIYLISVVMLFSLKVVGGVGVYKLSKFVYAGEREVLYTLPVMFYLLSPAQLNASYYLYAYAFAPWFVYLVFKILKFNRIEIQDLVWLSVILFFSSINLPNPKYVFHLFVIAVVVFGAGFFLRFITIRFFFKNFWQLTIFCLLTAYLVLPQLVFVSYYSPDKYDVHIKAEYKDEGLMMDFGDAALFRMFKLHKDTLNLNVAAKEQYNGSAVINLLSYAFIIAIIANVVFIRRSDSERGKYQYMLLLLATVYLFFAAGPNPPLGFLYVRMVEGFPLLAFLRTTAGATFYLSIFYALLLFPAVLNWKTVKNQNLFLGLFLLACCIVGYPLLTGESYKNVKVVSPSTDITKRGIVIPGDYFEMREQLDSLRIDAKVLYTNPQCSYIATKWGFFGHPIYNFLYNSSNVDCVNITNPSLHNIGIIFSDKSSIYTQSCPVAISEGNIIKKTDFIELGRISNDLFLPHFYTPQNIIKFSGSPAELLEIVLGKDFKVRTAVLSGEDAEKLDSLGYNGAKGNPVVEFKRINPTKYRVIVHGAQDDFPLVFSESFHSGWKVYSSAYKKTTVNFSGSGYKILAGNAAYQATEAELKDFVNRGLVTSLGDARERTIRHMKWQTNEEKPDYDEKYNFDFVSKNFQDTIQNNNLLSGYFWETWFKKPLAEDSHLTANGYANAWLIETAKICGENPSACVKNSDGTYDLELIVEFWPQRLLYFGIFVSGFTLFACLSYLLGVFIKRRMKIAQMVIKGAEKR